MHSLKATLDEIQQVRVSGAQNTLKPLGAGQDVLPRLVKPDKMRPSLLVCTLYSITEIEHCGFHIVGITFIFL